MSGGGEEFRHITSNGLSIGNDGLFTSPDGYSNHNTPEVYPHPHNSQNCTGGDHSIPHNQQDGALEDIIVVMIGEEERCVSGDQHCKEEEPPPDISTDGFSNHNIPEIYPQPHNSQDCTGVNGSIPSNQQDDLLKDIKVEMIEEEEERCVRGDQHCKEEEILTDISTAFCLAKKRMNKFHFYPKKMHNNQRTNIYQHLYHNGNKYSPIMAPTHNRKRNRNFTKTEVEKLVDLVLEKIYDGPHELGPRQRAQAWEQITDELNAFSKLKYPNVDDRYSTMVKKRWQDFRTNLKRKLKSRDKYIRRRGAGRLPESLQLTPVEERGAWIIRPQEVRGEPGYVDAAEGAPRNISQAAPTLVSLHPCPVSNECVEQINVLDEQISPLLLDSESESLDEAPMPSTSSAQPLPLPPPPPLLLNKQGKKRPLEMCLSEQDAAMEAALQNMSAIIQEVSGQQEGDTATNDTHKEMCAALHRLEEQAKIQNDSIQELVSTQKQILEVMRQTYELKKMKYQSLQTSQESPNSHVTAPSYDQNTSENVRRTTRQSAHKPALSGLDKTQRKT